MGEDKNHVVKQKFRKRGQETQPFSAIDLPAGPTLRLRGLAGFGRRLPP